MHMESFSKHSVLRYQKLQDRLRHKRYGKLVIDSVEDAVKHIEIPSNVFTHLIQTQHCMLCKYLPYHISLSKLDRGDNSWIKHANYLGINDGDVLKLYLDPIHDHSIVSLLWILLHEFRHKVQHNNKYIRSVIDNNNVKLWKSSYNVDVEIVNHVLHEVTPAEVDANMFACETLGIKYPGSKFNITKKTLGLLHNS